MGLESIITHFGMLVTHFNEIGKKKTPLQIAKAFWCRWWDLNPHVVAYNRF